ncbi:MerR family transcriptional regulator [Rugamonas sp.]|uniref:MerR family transcriptional regulator n=1 Tax=Rugamonas sp. TaxID=1926287 RepID=UPI0025D93C6C|nr:MerR family transcriptional regulator [Rugamonas sp.]
MKRTVKQIAKASGTSVRALHYYDQIGLLKPEVGDNGYRYYGQAEMLRLQQILFYRELGITLADIARMLDDPAFDTRATLVDLRQRVEIEIDRRRDLARSLDRTLALLDAGRPLSGKGMFDGVSAEKQAAWEAELVARYDDPAAGAIEQSRVAMAALSPAGLIDFKAEIDAIHAAFIALIEAGATPDSADAQAQTARHYRWVSRSWRPDAQAYGALGALYTDHAEFRAMYDALHPALARFLADAMALHARQALGRSPA